MGIYQQSLTPFVSFERIEMQDACKCLEAWGHKMGAFPVDGFRNSTNGTAHALLHEGRPVAITTTHTLIRDCVGGGGDLPINRGNSVELSRLCAERAGLCRVALRLWREFVFAGMDAEYAISYQDADLHNGDTYRFDGWVRLPEKSRSGTDQRSGREGRDKWVWVWKRRVDG